MGLRHVRGRALRRAAVGVRRDRARARRVGPVVDIDDTLFRHFAPGVVEPVDAAARWAARGVGAEEGDAQGGGEGEVGPGHRHCALGGTGCRASAGRGVAPAATAACVCGREVARELEGGSWGVVGRSERS